MVGGGLGRLVELCWCVTVVAVVVWMAAVVVVVKELPPVHVCVLSRRAEKQCQWPTQA